MKEKDKRRDVNVEREYWTDEVTKDRVKEREGEMLIWRVGYMECLRERREVDMERV